MSPALRTRPFVLPLVALAGLCLAASLAKPADAAPIVTLGVVIERVTQTECVDDGLFGCGSGADFYAAVELGDTGRATETGAIHDRNDIFPNWDVSRPLDLAQYAGGAAIVPVRIDIWDSDGGLRGASDHVDVWPERGRGIDLLVDLRTCNVRGDVNGQCGDHIVREGNESDRARLQFRVYVLGAEAAPTPLPGAPAGLQVRCLHEPLWPQPGQPVTIHAEAVDLRTEGTTVTPVNADIEIYLDGLAMAVRGCGAVPACDYSTPPQTGSSFSYGCMVRGWGSELWTGWRSVAVGDPGGSLAVPVMVTGDRKDRIDLVFLPDAPASFTGGNDPAFAAAAGRIIFEGYFREQVYLHHQQSLNFWLSLASLPAESYGTFPCWWTGAPLWWDNRFSFADAGAVVHTRPASFRDCAHFGAKLFTAPLNNLPVAVHETGHSPFGLADEYCCDGGYHETGRFPNLYEEPDACRADLNPLRAWDRRLRQNTDLRWRECREFEEDDPWLPDNTDWSLSDPGGGHLMDDNGTMRGGDYRRIHNLLKRCAAGEGGCNGH